MDCGGQGPMVSQPQIAPKPQNNWYLLGQSISRLLQCWLGLGLPPPRHST